MDKSSKQCPTKPKAIRFKNPAAREFHKMAMEAGFQLIRHNKHLVYAKDGCPKLVVSANPSDGRAVKNNTSRLRRALRESERKGSTA